MKIGIIIQILLLVFIMKRVKAGDTIIFDSVSRMSGNADDGFAAYTTLTV